MYVYKNKTRIFYLILSEGVNKETPIRCVHVRTCHEKKIQNDMKHKKICNIILEGLTFILHNSYVLGNSESIDTHAYRKLIMFRSPIFAVRAELCGHVHNFFLLTPSLSAFEGLNFLFRS